LCVADATNNAFESIRIAKILECVDDYLVETAALEALIDGIRSSRQGNP
jgi:hypothetical protein